MEYISNRLAIIFFSFSLFPAFVNAADSSWVFGIAQSNVHIGGGMDGLTSVSGGGSTEVFPLLEDSTGTKISIGIYNFELSLNISDHEGIWQGAPYDAQYRGFNLDYVKPFNLSNRFKPVVLFGVGAGSVIVNNGSIGATTEDATIFQSVFRYGLGLHIRISNATFLEFMSIRYSGEYTSINGVQDGTITSDINSKGTINTIGIKVLF